MGGDYYSYNAAREKELARAYVPFQIMNQVYSPKEALDKGTLFPELYRPYHMEGKGVYGGGFNG